MFTEYAKLKPVCVDIVGDLEKFHDEFNPLSEDGKCLIYPKIVNYLSKAGYVFDNSSEVFYKLYSDGLYYLVHESDLKREIYTLVNIANHHFNVESRHVKSIIDNFKSLSTTYALELKFCEFLSTEIGMDYDIGYDMKQKGYHLIQLSNGIFNPCLRSEDYPFTLLPNCGYYFQPEGLGSYNLDFYPIPESEIFSMNEYDDFMEILPDKESLEFFLWWSGAVLFSYPFKLPMFLLLYGPGGTGKTTLIGCLLSILGRSGGHANLSNIIDQKGQSCFIGKRLNLSSEMEGNYDKRLISSIKDITGGEPIQVEQKYKQPIEIFPPALAFTGNVFPEIDTSDTGVLRRAYVISCSKNLENSGVDWPTLMKDNDHKNWLFNSAYYYWTKNKDKLPNQMESDSMRAMKHEMKLFNPFMTWLEDDFKTTNRDLLRTNWFNGKSLNELYSRYSDSVYSQLGKPMSSRKFSLKIKNDFGMELISNHDVKVFRPILD